MDGQDSGAIHDAPLPTRKLDPSRTADPMIRYDPVSVMPAMLIKALRVVEKQNEHPS
jgi:hypothetical protein